MDDTTMPGAAPPSAQIASSGAEPSPMPALPALAAAQPPKRSDGVKASPWIAICLSVLSLVVSAAGFYWDKLRVAHDVFVVASDGIGQPDPATSGAEPNVLPIAVSIFNGGNRPEAVLDLSFAYRIEARNLRGIGHSDSPKAFTLKPGDIQTFVVSVPATLLDVQIARQPSQWIDFGYNLTIVEPDGELRSEFHRVGQVRHSPRLKPQDKAMEAATADIVEGWLGPAVRKSMGASPPDQDLEWQFDPAKRVVVLRKISLLPWAD